MDIVIDPPALIRALAGGLMIGAAGALLLLGNGRIMGASGILGRTLANARDGRVERLAFLAGLVGVPALIVAATGSPDTNVTTRWPLLVAAGLLVGLGTRLGSGCTSGHGVCGMSRLSPRSILATVTFIAAGIATVRLLGPWL